nr:ribonuclease H-like domain, reverse transcriptase, RNA-dependent DNA polymerase [Tanacetum cinerariifolium]
EQEVSLHEKDVGYKETIMYSLWYLDNEASNHMTGVREHFKELDEEVSGKVRFGDGSSIKIKGKGSILIECDDEKQRIISHLWHARLEHLNFESLKSMAQRDLVQGTPAIKHTTQVCDVCLIGKHSRAPFPKKAKVRSTSPLDLVYGDLCGPITPPTPSGKKYIFLDLKKEVCVTQPEGFIKRQDNGKVYRLIKALYGLRQAPRAWNIKLDNTLKSLNFKKCAMEQAIYTKTSKDSTLLIGVYVDDLIITDTPKEEIDKFKTQTEEKFEMSDLGLLAYYLGIEVTQTNDDILIK